MSVKMSNSNRFQRRSDFEIAGLYDLEKTIGKGHFAVVKLARHVFTNEKVAVKVIDKTKLDEISKSHLFQEVRCMKLVQHPNVVRLYEVIDTQTKLYLILELGDGGDMYDYIMKHDKGLPEDKARRYFRQIVEAISYCHKLHVVHRDLKPENVVFFEKLGIVKLTDFGFSNMFNPGKKLETSCGSLAYSAPEILLGDSYDAPAVDVWSLGVILFMLVCGVPPFQEANDSETLTMIMDCKYLVPDHISSSCRDLIHKMLQREPVHRAKLGDILNHEWLCMGDYIAPSVPLISREHLSDDDHNYLIEKMVEGNIATKDEILQSLDRDLYDHITATYYLLAERKLKRHHQEMALAQIRKHSAPADHSSPAHSLKPNLELSLSPRATSPYGNTEVKKTRTAPLFNQTALDIPVSPPPVESRHDFMKSLTTSMTLDRRAVKSNIKTDRSGSLTGAEPSPVFQLAAAQRSGSVSPQTGIRRFLPSLGTIPDTVLTGSRSSTDLDKISQSSSNSKKKGFAPISKIQILKSFFERKVAQLSGKPTTPDRFTGLFKPPKSSKDKLVQSKEPKEEQLRRPKTSIVQSLVSPPGTHPTPSTTPDSQSRGSRKFSLIQEESIDDDEEEELMDIDPGELRPAKSVESLDDGIPWKGSNQNMPSFEPFQVKRPLMSVASSPQLLNQICEENETDVEEEDDFVPNKLHSPKLRMSRGSCASPEVLRKYEQRKKRSGSKVTSCSSSDASDTDDTEKRSRKDKLKPKFMHRSRPEYRGIIHAFRSIQKSSGFSGLYQGVKPNVLGSASSWGFYFMFYNTIKTSMQDGDTKVDLGAGKHTLAASCAGLLTLVLTNPIWVVKTRLCLQYEANATSVKSEKYYSGMADALYKIYKQEGFRGYYKGFLPGMFGISHGAIQFVCYEELKTKYNNFKERPIDYRLNSAEYITFAALSKILAATVTYPYQVVRSRLQDQHRSYNGIVDVLQKIYRYEGLWAFYKGLTPNLLRVTPACCITFVVYENIISMCHKNK